VEAQWVGWLQTMAKDVALFCCQQLAQGQEERWVAFSFFVFCLLNN